MVTDTLLPLLWSACTHNIAFYMVLTVCVIHHSMKIKWSKTVEKQNSTYMYSVPHTEQCRGDMCNYRQFQLCNITSGMCKPLFAAQH